MKIPEKLNSKSYDNSLLVLANLKKVKIYHISDDHVSEILKKEIDEPRYTDRIGYFKKKAKKHVFSAGSHYEWRKVMMERELEKQLKNSINGALYDLKINKVYLFIPKNLKNLRGNLGKAGRAVKRVVEGNYNRATPLKLLSMLR